VDAKATAADHEQRSPGFRLLTLGYRFLTDPAAGDPGYGRSMAAGVHNGPGHERSGVRGTTAPTKALEIGSTGDREYWRSEAWRTPRCRLNGGRPCRPTEGLQQGNSNRETPTGKLQQTLQGGTPSAARGLVWSHKNNLGRSDAGSSRRQFTIEQALLQRQGAGPSSRRRLNKGYFLQGAAPTTGCRPDSKAAQPQETVSTPRDRLNPKRPSQSTNRPNHEPPARRGRPVGFYTRIGLSPALRERVPIGRLPLGRVAIGRRAIGRRDLEAGDSAPATCRGHDMP
jgi:hypothetical protein